MCCCKKNNKKNKLNKIHPEKEYKSISIQKNNEDKKVSRRESIYPKVNKNIIEENKSNLKLQRIKKEEFTKKFLAEIIHCGNCKEKFSLGNRAIQMTCGSCNNFFHCGIAGACVGPKCSVIYEGNIESTKYCIGCVNPYLKINVLDNGLSLCKICEIDPKIDKKFLEV